MNYLAKNKKNKSYKINKCDIIQFARSNYIGGDLNFEKDYQIIKYLKVQFNKFLNNKKINLRLVLNYIITLNNVFINPKVLCKVLFLECDKETWGILATFLYFLRLSPETLIGYNNTIIEVKNIIDWGLLEKLNEL